MGLEKKMNDGSVKGHFVLINNLDLFLSKVTQTKSGVQTYRKYWCPICITSHYSPKILTDHAQKCNREQRRKFVQKEIFPKKMKTKLNDPIFGIPGLDPDYKLNSETLYFKNYDNRYLVNIIGFYDIECLVTKYHGASRCACFKVNNI